MDIIIFAIMARPASTLGPKYLSSTILLSRNWVGASKNITHLYHPDSLIDVNILAIHNSFRGLTVNINHIDVVSSSGADMSFEF